MKVETLKVRGVRARPVAAPMKRPLATSSGTVSVAPLLLIDLETDAGITGRSYLFAIGQANLPPLKALVDAMGRLLDGDVVAPFDLERKLRARYALLGVHNIVLFAMSGIDMAAWDALGQALGQPLVRLLGGAPRPIPAYNSKGLGIMPLKPLVKEATELVAEALALTKAAGALQLVGVNPKGSRLPLDLWDVHFRRSGSAAHLVAAPPSAVRSR
jgi:mandelate racemase